MTRSCDVFARLDPEEFRACFLSWVQSVMTVTQDQVIAIDGKTVRRAHNRRLGQGAIHRVSAWAQTNCLVLGQVKVDEKSNEITAIPALLWLLDVAGCLVTMDAMGTQTAMAEQMVAQRADYVLAVKDNQERLAQDVTGRSTCSNKRKRPKWSSKRSGSKPAGTKPTCSVS